MKRPFQLVAEIQDKDTEIERLRKTIFQLTATITARAEHEAEIITEVEDRFKSLLIRAADALEVRGTPRDSDLIAELRKAAQ